MKRESSTHGKKSFLTNCLAVFSVGALFLGIFAGTMLGRLFNQPPTPSTPLSPSPKPAVKTSVKTPTFEQIKTQHRQDFSIQPQLETANQYQRHELRKGAAYLYSQAGKQIFQLDDMIITVEQGRLPNVFFCFTGNGKVTDGVMMSCDSQTGQAYYRNFSIEIPTDYEKMSEFVPEFLSDRYQAFLTTVPKTEFDYSSGAAMPLSFGNYSLQQPNRAIEFRTYHSKKEPGRTGLGITIRLIAPEGYKEAPLYTLKIDNRTGNLTLHSHRDDKALITSVTADGRVHQSVQVGKKTFPTTSPRRAITAKGLEWHIPGWAPPKYEPMKLPQPSRGLW